MPESIQQVRATVLLGRDGMHRISLHRLPQVHLTRRKRWQSQEKSINTPLMPCGLMVTGRK